MHSLTRDLRFRAASDADRDSGLLGWATFGLRGLAIDGAQVRRTRDGRMRMFWPEHLDAHGRRHATVKPSDSVTAYAIESEVLGELRRRGHVQ